MDGSYQWHTMYKTKLARYLLLKPIFSHNTNCFCADMLCNLNRTVSVWYTYRSGIELYTSLMTFKHSLLFSGHRYMTDSLLQ